MGPKPPPFMKNLPIFRYFPNIIAQYQWKNKDTWKTSSCCYFQQKLFEADYHEHLRQPPNKPTSRLHHLPSRLLSMYTTHVECSSQFPLAFHKALLPHHNSKTPSHYIIGMVKLPVTSAETLRCQKCCLLSTALMFQWLLVPMELFVPLI